MKAVCAALFAAVLAAAPIAASPADTDRTLENVKGQVTYGTASSPTTPLAVHARTTIADSDFAATGANSQATLTFPDSSQVILGENTRIQVNSFVQSDIAHAKMTVNVGKVRFKVNHPQGAKADYQFQTPTGQIAVRGTEGDFFSNPSGLQVNVYAVSNPALPVQVTLVNGQVFTLAAGQSLVASAVAGAVTASVTSVSQALYSPFSEFPAPANAGSLGISASAGAAGASAGAAGATTGLVTAAGAAAAGAAAAVVTSNSSNPKSTPAPSTPTPSPAPSTTSVPITVNGAPRMPGHERPGPRPSPLP